MNILGDTSVGVRLHVQWYCIVALTCIGRWTNCSKSLTETESRYSNIEREILDIVFGHTRHTYMDGT